MFFLLSLVLEQVFLILRLRVETDQHVNCLVQNLLAYLLDDLFLLDVLPIHVQRQVIRVHNGLNEVEVLGQELLELIVDQHPPHEQFDLVLLLIELVELVIWGPFWDVHQTCKVHISLSLEVGPC